MGINHSNSTNLAPIVFTPELGQLVKDKGVISPIGRRLDNDNIFSFARLRQTALKG
jgi:hypothetical protein